MLCHFLNAIQLNLQLKTSGGSTQGLGGAKPPQITKKKDLAPPNSKGGT